MSSEGQPTLIFYTNRTKWSSWNDISTTKMTLQTIRLQQRTLLCKGYKNIRIYLSRDGSSIGMWHFHSSVQLLRIQYTVRNAKFWPVLSFSWSFANCYINLTVWLLFNCHFFLFYVYSSYVDFISSYANWFTLSYFISPINLFSIERDICLKVQT